MTDSTRHAYLRVRQAILDGELAPGASVSQVQLAATLAVSRTPLREALRLLENEGLVESRYNRRVRVRPVSAADLETVTVLRLAAEPLGVRLGVPRLSPADLDAAAAALDEADPAGALSRDAHRRFHLALLGPLDPALRRHVTELWDHAERYRVRYLDAGPGDRAARAARDHRLLLAAARDGDGALCARRDAEHLARTAFAVTAEIDSTHEPRLLRETLRHVLDALPSDPASTDPASTDRASTDPASTDPVSTGPGRGDLQAGTR